MAPLADALARQAGLALLNRVGSGTLVAAFALRPGLVLIQPPTADRGRLDQAVRMATSHVTIYVDYERQYEQDQATAGSAPRCELLRFAANGCAFCSAAADGGWRLLAKAGARLGCRIVEIALFGDLPLDGLRVRHRMVLTVSPEFAESTRLSRTPTTLLLVHGRVAWEKMGIVSPADVPRAVRVLRLARRWGPLEGLVP